MNTKQFDEVENPSSQNSDDAVPNEASSIIKVEEKEAKFEDSHISNKFISETRSEGGIEDQHKLDELTEKEDPQIFEETKSKRSYDKRNKKKNKKKQWQKKKREAAKEEKKLAKKSKNS